jgi:hypothetical protein
LVSAFAFPPVQLLKLAESGETVTERIVGTAFNESEIDPPLVAAGAGLLANTSTAISRATPTNTNAQVLLRRTLSS